MLLIYDDDVIVRRASIIYWLERKDLSNRHGHFATGTGADGTSQVPVCAGRALWISMSIYYDDLHLKDFQESYAYDTSIGTVCPRQWNATKSMNFPQEHRRIDVDVKREREARLTITHKKILLRS